MPYPRYFQIKLLPLCFCHGLDNCLHGRNHIVKREFLIVKYNLPALDFGYIQNIVNQTEQMLPRSHNLFRVFPHFARIFRILC